MPSKTLMVLAVGVGLRLMSPDCAQANIPKSDYLSPVEKTLQKPGMAKFTELKQLGPGVYKELRGLAFDEHRPLNTRWQAFMAMVRIGEKESLPEVETALKSGQWYLRNAAIQVLPLLDQDKAYNAAVRGLDDSALVVRTAAVDALKELKRSDSASLLWERLYSKKNYMRSESLWIRRHIVEALSEIAPAGSEDKFVKVLDDQDSTLFEPAIKGLERLTGKKLGEAGVPAVYRRYFWKKWHQDKSKKNS